MDFELSEEQRILTEAVEKFAAVEVAPGVAAREESGEFDRAMVNQVVPHEKLDETVRALCERLVKGPARAIRYSKKPVNQYLRWMMSLVFDYACALESQLALELMSLRDKSARAATASPS